MRLLIFVAMLCLAGCAPRLSFANERGGVINKSGSLGNDRAYAMAEAQCRMFGRVARISSRDVLTNTIRFDCVEK